MQFKFKIFTLIALLGLLSPVLQAENENNLITTGDIAFEKEDYTEALQAYSTAFENRLYTEKTLYRLAFLEESLRNYPRAIFYLRKIQQEYGGELLEEKVIQLMQKNGSAHYLTADVWPKYFLFFKHWGWIIWGLFFLALGWLLVRLLVEEKKLPSFSGGLTAGAASLFSVLTLVLLHNLFFTPQRAVITGSTAFYEFPSYGAKYELTALSTGETVDLIDSEDIWVQVEAGHRRYWIPRQNVEEL